MFGDEKKCYKPLKVKQSRTTIATSKTKWFFFSSFLNNRGSKRLFLIIAYRCKTTNGKKLAANKI